MPVPLVGIAVTAAAKLAAKKLAQNATKKAATAAVRARANSAAAAKAVAPKKSTRPVKYAKRVYRPGEKIKVDSNPAPVRKVVPAIPLGRGTANVTRKVTKVRSTLANGRKTNPVLKISGTRTTNPNK
jgi:hypothetical protein